MPATQAEALSTTAKHYFSGRGIKLPMQWKSMGSQYPDAFRPAELSTPANMPRSLFHEPTLNKYHTQAANTLGREYEQYIDGICRSISDAVAKWMQNASVVAATIMGPVGNVLPGSVIGPVLEPMIMASAPQATASEFKYSTAIAAALSSGWLEWQQGLCGVLSYPGFAAAATATAPPTPNVAVPLITWSSAGEAGLSPQVLAKAMEHRFNEPGALHAQTLFDAVARAFHIHFQTFKSTTTVVNVIGTGPVPMVPGPVASGTVIPTPGNFI